MTSGGNIVRRETASPARSGSPQLRGSEVITEFLVFTVGSERMGLPLASVQEILKPAAPTLVPRAPRDVLGILSVRGRITTVLDLRRRLGMAEMEQTRQTRILLVEGAEETMGVVVDAVLHVVRLRGDEIEGADVVASDVAEHVLGLGRPRRQSVRGAAAQEARSDASDDEVIVLLDPVALLRR
jgi:purine-binding chemotaxis protein CheW